MKILTKKCKWEKFQKCPKKMGEKITQILLPYKCKFCSKFFSKTCY